MFERSQIKNVIDVWQDWQGTSHKTSLPRQIQLILPKNNALAIIGVRRCGKSFVAARLAGEALDSCLSVNFEDPFFIDNNTTPVLDELISVYAEYSQKLPTLLLFDEIYHIQGWERWIRKQIDLKKYNIILTGSSAQMLSSELATSLTGRCITKEIWPLSFSEFLAFKNIQCRSANEYLGMLREYMLWGGFPDVVLTEAEHEKKDLLRQYLLDIVYKDIIMRHEIRAPRMLEQIINFYLTHISNLHSYNSVRKAFGMNVDTVGEYTRFCQMCYLLFEVPRYHKNLKVQSRDPKKIYSVDSGLRNVNTAGLSEDRGLLAENIVYLELRRRGHNVYYFKNKGEVDFVTVAHNKITQAIQVCYDNLTQPKTREREINSLLECLDDTGLDQGLILTLNLDQTETIKKKKIRYMPLYQWLLADHAT